MSSVVSFPAGKSFEYTFYQSYNADPETEWVNTFKVLSVAPGELDDLIELGRAAVASFASILWDLAKVTRWRVSTGAYEDPQESINFYEEPANVAGYVLSTGNHITDKRIVLWLEKSATYGRPGRIFLRGSLCEEYITAQAGKIAIDPAAVSTINGRIATFKTGISTWLADDPGTKPIRLALMKWNGADQRWVKNILLRGVTIAKHDHVWYNRAAGTPYVEGSYTPQTNYSTELEDPPPYVEEPES